MGGGTDKQAARQRGAAIPLVAPHPAALPKIRCWTLSPTRMFSLAVIDSRGPVRATLELAAGTTARLNIRVGDKVQQRIFGNGP